MKQLFLKTALITTALTTPSVNAQTSDHRGMTGYLIDLLHKSPSELIYTADPYGDVGTLEQIASNVNYNGAKRGCNLTVWSAIPRGSYKGDERYWDECLEEVITSKRSAYDESLQQIVMTVTRTTRRREMITSPSWPLHTHPSLGPWTESVESWKQHYKVYKAFQSKFANFQKLSYVFQKQVWQLVDGNADRLTLKNIVTQASKTIPTAMLPSYVSDFNYALLIPVKTQPLPDSPKTYVCGTTAFDDLYLSPEQGFATVKWTPSSGDDGSLGKLTVVSDTKEGLLPNRQKTAPIYLSHLGWYHFPSAGKLVMLKYYDSEDVAKATGASLSVLYVGGGIICLEKP